MASLLGAPWIALTVETAASDLLPEEDRARVASHLAVAGSLGAETLVVRGEAVAREILARSKLDVTEDAYLVYGFNRFQACRFGLQGEIVDPFTRERRPLMDDISATLDAIRAHARPDDDEALREIVRCLEEGNDAAWLRQRFAETGSLGRVVGMQLEHFAGKP